MPVRPVVPLLSCMVALIGTPCQAADPYAAARHQMVRTEIIGAGIKDRRVIQAIDNTPRHEFVSGRQRPYAYYDMAIPIGYGQTISPPYVVAFMTEKLDPRPTDKVLEIGTGSGYQAAVLSGLVDQVYTIEIVEPLGRRAAETLRRLGCDNVHTKIGDGYRGWPEHAPFDKIIVTCSPENIPQPLVDQLAEGGSIVVPLGERFQQTLYRMTKTEGQLKRQSLEGTFFVPMTGLAEQNRDVLPDPTRPHLVHGGFEKTAQPSDAPAGWFYVRQGRVVTDPRVPEGERCVTFNNSLPGRNAHAMQAFGVDGREVRRLQVSVWVRGEQLRAGPTSREQAQLILEFYDARRAPVGHDGLGPWSGSFDWRQQRTQVAVPASARLAVVGIGLFGATGQAWFDGVEVTATANPP